MQHKLFYTFLTKFKSGATTMGDPLVLGSVKELDSQSLSIL